MTTETFTIDPRDPMIIKHNREVREVWESWKADRPLRVPVIFDDARTVHADENNCDYSRYYNDPAEMMRLQLQWAKRHLELPFGDTLLGELPERWGLAVDFHPVLIPACFGCEVVYRPDAVPAHHGLNLTKQQCQTMVMPNLQDSGLLPKLREFRLYFQQAIAGDFRFMGRPVVSSLPGLWLGTLGAGVFSLALDIRGGEIMADMYDNPDFVHRFLRRLADWQIGLYRHWSRLNGVNFELDQPGGTGLGPTDHGIDMLSVEMYETFLASLLQDLNRGFQKTPNPALHHCGRGSHLFPAIKKHFGLEHLHALTYPLNDVGRIRRELGDETWITALIAADVIAAGPATRIRQTVKEFLTPEVKGKGRLAIWVSAEARHIPPEHFLALYEAVKEFGRY